MRSPFKAVSLAFALTVAVSAHAEQFGRLFFTPEQRNQLDYSYSREASTGKPSNALMLNGIVQKQGGKRTVWINGVPQTVGSGDEKSPESVTVPLPGQKKSVKLKVGQRVLLNPGASPADTPNESVPQQ